MNFQPNVQHSYPQKRNDVNTPENTDPESTQAKPLDSEVVSCDELLALSDGKIAKILCESMGETSMMSGDCRGNQFRWEDYIECVGQFRASVEFYSDTLG